MAEYEKYLVESGHPKELVAMAKEILKLRSMLWLSHGHKRVYGDDGEMQCGDCAFKYGFYDWKRTPIDEIKAKIFQANLNALGSLKNIKKEYDYDVEKEFTENLKDFNKIINYYIEKLKTTI